MDGIPRKWMRYQETLYQENATIPKYLNEDEHLVDYQTISPHTVL